MNVFSAVFSDTNTGETDFSDNSPHFIEFEAAGWMDAFYFAVAYGFKHNADLDSLEIDRQE